MLILLKLMESFLKIWWVTNTNWYQIGINLVLVESRLKVQSNITKTPIGNNCYQMTQNGDLPHEDENFEFNSILERRCWYQSDTKLVIGNKSLKNKELVPITNCYQFGTKCYQMLPNGSWLSTIVSCKSFMPDLKFYIII